MLNTATERWIDAEAATGDGPQVLTAEQVAGWRERGFAFVSNVVPEPLVASLQQQAREIFPAIGSAESKQIRSFGSALVFPAEIEAFNEVTLHPRLLTSVSQLLGVEDIRLSQSDLWPKYGHAEGPVSAFDNSDQRIHIDYPNHTLTHPTEWSRPEAVEMILYLDDVDRCGGATAVVPRGGDDDPAYRWPIVDSPGIGDLRYVNDRAAAERYLADKRPELADWRSSLYDRELLVRYRPGDLLLYRHDTWHRGTPMRDNQLRLAHNLTFRRAGSEWISTLHTGWAWAAYRRSAVLERLIATASLTQRAVLGFPQPGSSYWSEATIAAVEARYGVYGMDMTPYRQALAGA